MPRVTPQLYIDAIQKILDPRFRELEPEVGARGFTGLQVKGINEANRTVTAVVSAPSVDRYGEIVLPEAFERHLDRFMSNPVLVANHCYGIDGEPTVIGHWTEMRITKEGLIGTALFMHDDELAEKWWRRFVQRACRAFSVGFLTLAYEMRPHKDADGKIRSIRTFTEVELLEISAVTIPANRDAVVRTSGGGTSGGGSGGQRSNRSIERVIREEIARQMRADSAAMKTLIADVVRATLEETAQLDPYGGYGPEPHHLSIDDFDDPPGPTDDDEDEADEEHEEDEMTEEDKALIDGLREALR